MASENHSGFSLFTSQYNRKIQTDLQDQHEKDIKYISELEKLLAEHGITVPDDMKEKISAAKEESKTADTGLMADGSLDALSKSIGRIKSAYKAPEVNVHFKDLSFWSMVPEMQIPTVGSMFKNMILGSGPKHRANVLFELTGRILPRKMTLVMGPPGSGKSTLLKALSGALTVGSAHLDGTITYNSSTPNSGNYIIQKLADYVDEKDQHAATLTVFETLDFAFMVTTGGRHSYMVARDQAGAELLDKNNELKVKLNNVLAILGLAGVKDTVVGDGMLRGVSGGQKRRVTLGEMLMPPRLFKYMDSISTGLDASTTFDIVQALKFVSSELGITTVISLLQPSPEVFNSFDEIILLSEGQIFYHGPVNKVLDYFQDMGYICPPNVDVADFLQEVPTPEGKKFIKAGDAGVPTGTAALVGAWKSSTLFKNMLAEMEDNDEKNKTFEWTNRYREPYATSFWVSFKMCFERQKKLTLRDTDFLKGRLMQNILVGVIAGTLFSNLDVTEQNSMSGILFFSCLFLALASMSMLPIIFAQRDVFYKHAKAYFFPTPSFVLAQSLVLFPLQVVETLLFSLIVYWSVGLTEDEDGSRFFTFMLICLSFALCAAQMFRLIASFMPTPTTAQPLAGVLIVLMVLFSGYIIPKNQIPPGWIWYYWLNPLAHALKSVTVNEYLASDYDFCVVPDCSDSTRFGDAVLEERGNPTEQVWVWYGFAVLIGEYLGLLFLTFLALTYLRVEPTPPPPIHVKDQDEQNQEVEDDTEIPFEPVTFGFRDIWYTVTLGNGEELDLLKGVDGFFEAGTVTALMGSSGAGKTTLLDVLAGRKNTGVIKGDIMVNGKPKQEDAFRRIMGYVEQFDTLAPNDTAREAIEFAAALRLPGNVTKELRAAWVTKVLKMLELQPLENTLIGSVASGGMSFEQKKRVSIGVELAANPAILFLDEPTSGLDSRSAQVVIRCIRRVAASGRGIVCTIHQPSTYIFDAFDSLLLLRRGGQTVFFGELGESSQYLVEYFQGVPDVRPMPAQYNPATWMLEVIGAGTGGAEVTTDFHAYYKNSSLCTINTTKVNAICSPLDIENEGTLYVAQEGGAVNPQQVKPAGVVLKSEEPLSKYTASYSMQFEMLMTRFWLSYWRSPSYNAIRIIVSIIIALIFSSTYADQDYGTDTDVISRVALIYITVLFLGIVAMTSVQPVVFSDRPAFYREQYSQLYDIKLYVLAGTIVELPYLLISSVMFLIPYFFIVGFDRDGTAEKFFWYWLYTGLYVSVMVYIGQLVAYATPNDAVASVIGGMLNTIMSLFCGFMIIPSDFPTFWIFMYWLVPLHYALEGLTVTQFKGDDTAVETFNGFTTTAETLVQLVYPDWEYKNRIGDFVALILFIVMARVCTYLSLTYIRHDKR